MNIENEIGQLFFIGIQGTELSSDEADFIVKNNIGGITLFGRNCQEPQQLHKLCSDIQNLRHKMPNKTPLFIAIDMEGGRVHRLKAPFTQWPAVGQFTDIDSSSLAFKFSNYMGSELKAVGINLDYAPCVDLLTNPENKIIGDRSIGTDIEHVGKIASALVRGYIKAGIAPCVKHFPGHGNTIVDSHEDLPVDTIDEKTLLDREVQPFKRAFRARVEFCMTAHIKYENVDSEFPATLSRKIITDILKNNLRYQKLVITDDLDMKALRNHYDIKEIPVLAMQAGCDILLYCNEFDVPPQALEAVKQALSEGKIDKNAVSESLSKLMESKRRALKEPDPPPFEEAVKVIGHPDHLRVAKAVENKEIPEDLST